MRTVILGDWPVEIEAMMEARKLAGADQFDEVWEGVYHVAPAPTWDHASLVLRVGGLLDRLGRQVGLRATADFNLGSADDYRIPDVGLHRTRHGALWCDTAALVVEITSPRDETQLKLPFYAAHDVEEVVIIDPVSRRIVWLRLAGSEYEQVGRSSLLDIDVAEVAARIEWPTA